MNINFLRTKHLRLLPFWLENSPDLRSLNRFWYLYSLLVWKYLWFVVVCAILEITGSGLQSHLFRDNTRTVLREKRDLEGQNVLHHRSRHNLAPNGIASECSEPLRLKIINFIRIAIWFYLRNSSAHYLPISICGPFLKIALLQCGKSCVREVLDNWVFSVERPRPFSEKQNIADEAVLPGKTI